MKNLIKKNAKKISFIIVILVLILGFFSTQISTEESTSNVANEPIEEDVKKFVNISECSKEFMDNYFEEIKKISKSENKEDILIITSETKPQNTYGATEIVSGPNNQYFLQYSNNEDKEKALEELKKDSSCIVEENTTREITDSTVLASGYNSWGIEAMGIDKLLNQISNIPSDKINDIKVAIIDTGLDIELFNQNYTGRLIEGYNIIDSNTTLTDNTGHGTHIAGTIAESTSKNIKIMPIRASENSKLYTSDIIESINYAIYNEANVMNMSFGGETSSYGEYLAIEAAKQKNIISVTSAGNNYGAIFNYPARFDNTIAVSSVDSNKIKAASSNSGDYITFSAPGENVLSINGIKSGTSMATPHIVGAVSFLKSMNKNISLEDIITILRRYTEDLGDQGWDIYYGYGFINFSNVKLGHENNYDEYGIFESSENEENQSIVKSYEIVPQITTYNYGTVNNILNTKVKIYYSNNKSVEYSLSELKNISISEYDPYSLKLQKINIDLTTPLGIKINDSFEITNPSSYETVWEYNKINENEIELIGFKDIDASSKKLYVPSKIDGYSVVAIADREESIFTNSWTFFSEVNELYLPSTLIKIGNKAFYRNGYSTNLNYVKSEADNISVGNYAFANTSLIKLDANVIYIGSYAFWRNTNLQEIKISENLKYIGEYAFHDALNGAKILIPQNATQINNFAFRRSHIREIEFLNEIEKIPDDMFEECKELQKVTFNGDYSEIGEEAFAGCEKLKAIILPESLTKIDKYAFRGAFDPQADVSLTIPKNVSYIGENAFNSSNLNEVCFMNNIKSIPYAAFTANFSLKKVSFLAEVNEIGQYSFSACNNLKDVYFNKEMNLIDESAFTKASKDIKFYVYNNTYPELFATEKHINYQTIDPTEIEIEVINNEYKAFDKVNPETDISVIKLYYDEGKNINGEYKEIEKSNEEIIDSNYTITYSNQRNSFRYGDNCYTVNGLNQYGIPFVKNVYVTVVENSEIKIIGDVNGDDEVDLIDCALLLRHAKDIEKLNNEQLERADVNNDNDVDLIDYALLLRHVKQIEPLY